MMEEDALGGRCYPNKPASNVTRATLALPSSRARTVSYKHHCPLPHSLFQFLHSLQAFAFFICGVFGDCAAFLPGRKHPAVFQHPPWNLSFFCWITILGGGPLPHGFRLAPGLSGPEPACFGECWSSSCGSSSPEHLGQHTVIFRQPCSTPQRCRWP